MRKPRRVSKGRSRRLFKKTYRNKRKQNRNSKTLYRGGIRM